MDRLGEIGPCALQYDLIGHILSTAHLSAQMGRFLEYPDASWGCGHGGAIRRPPGKAERQLRSRSHRKGPWGQYRCIGHRALVDIRIGKVRGRLEEYAPIFSAAFLMRSFSNAEFSFLRIAFLKLIPLPHSLMT